MIFNSNPNPVVNSTTETSLGVFNTYNIPPTIPVENRKSIATSNIYVPLVELGTINPPPSGTTRSVATGILYTTSVWNVSLLVRFSDGSIGYTSNLLSLNWAATYAVGSVAPAQPSDAMAPNLADFLREGLNPDSVLGHRWQFAGSSPLNIVGPSVEHFKEIRTTTTYTNQVLLKPQIADYFNGYSLDSTPYKIDVNISFLSSKSGDIKIHYYYKEDEIQLDSDGVAHQTISIQTIEFDSIKGKSYTLKFTCVPCSVSFEGNSVLIAQLRALLPERCLSDYLPIQKAEWEGLYQQQLGLLQSQPFYYQSINLDNTPYVWAATERWGQTSITDRNTGLGIGEQVNDSFVFDKYFKLNLDGTYGADMADSALLKLIGSSLQVNKWGLNPDDPDVPRVDNLGWRINRICDVAGIRVKTDGTIDTEKDKKLVRQVIDKNKNLDPKKTGVITFGELGMVVKRISNRFKRKGKNSEIVSDQCVIVQDIPQLMQEYFDQINLALGIQESSAIEIKQGEKGEDKAVFNSQLEILIELVNLMSSGNEMARAALVSSLVTQSQTSELIAGLGLPCVTKTIPIKIDKKTHQLPYKGIAAHRSISQEIATCTYNVGIVTGQLL